MTLRYVLLFCVLASIKNIAMNISPDVINDKPHLLIVGGSIMMIALDIIPRSLYNYYTEHNNRKPGYYQNKFFLYAGRKINITKNFYIDLYLSIYTLLLVAIDSYFTNKKNLIKFVLSLISFSFNIRIYKEFYISFTIGSIIILLVTIIAESILFLILDREQDDTISTNQLIN